MHNGSTYSFEFERMMSYKQYRSRGNDFHNQYVIKLSTRAAWKAAKLHQMRLLSDTPQFWQFKRGTCLE